MAVIIGSARIDERGKASGGQAGKQKRIEVSTQSWYKHSKGWRTFRCINARAAQMIAECMQWACDSPLIGYDQSQNTSLYKALDAVDFNLNKLTTKVETDCARLVRVCVRYAGIHISDFYTGNEASALLATGYFKELTGAKYNSKSDYLKTGDIQVTRTKGHTIVVLTDGPKAETTAVPEPEYVLGSRILRNGDEGSDVKELQLKLIELGYDCGSYGADGEFGDATELAVRKLQDDQHCLVDGEVGPETLEAIESMLKQESVGAVVRITGGDCFVREQPDKASNAYGVAHEGEVYDYLGAQSQDGWLKISWRTQPAWVSGKYGKLI